MTESLEKFLPYELEGIVGEENIVVDRAETDAQSPDVRGLTMGVAKG